MKSYFTPVLLALAGAAAAGEMPLLNDHLRITLPDQAEYYTPGAALMEAARKADETNIRVGKGADALYLRAREKHYTVDGDFAKGVKDAMAALNAGATRYSINQEGDNLVYALRLQAPKDVPADDAAVVCHAEYRHPDGSVQKFTIGAAAGAAKDMEKCRKAAVEWLKGIRPGNTPLQLQERVEYQQSYMKDCRVAVQVPQGYTATLSEGDGFHFTAYSKLVKRGDGPEEISVQVGDHPELVFEKVPAAEQFKQEGTLMGRKVQWHLYAAPGVYVAECVLPLGARGGEVTFSDKVQGEVVYVHISLYGKNAATRTELIRQAEKTTLEPLPKE